MDKGRLSHPTLLDFHGCLCPWYVAIEILLGFAPLSVYILSHLDYPNVAAVDLLPQ